MSRTVANLEVSTDTFQNWVNKTNELLYALTTEIVTANISGANTGTVLDNRIAQLIGKFGANTLVATAELRGGNVSSGGLLTINSNTVFGGNSTVNSSYVNAQANVFVNNAVTQINSYITTITGNTDVKSNSALTAMSVRGNNITTNTIFNGNDVFIFTNNTSVNSISIFTGNTYIKSNSALTLMTAQGDGTTSNVIFQGNLTQFTSNIDVTGTYHTINGNVYFDTDTLFVDAVNNKVGIKNTSPQSELRVTGNVEVSDTLTTNTLVATNLIFNTNYVIQVVANTNIGVSTSTPLLVYSFPKATYSGAKITAAIKTPTGNSQFSEMVLAHNTTDAFMTVYATVASPAAANAGFFSVAINNANVELSFQQTSATSAVKIVSHLIK